MALKTAHPTKAQERIIHAMLDGGRMSRHPDGYFRVTNLEGVVRHRTVDAMCKNGWLSVENDVGRVTAFGAMSVGRSL